VACVSLAVELADDVGVGLPSFVSPVVVSVPQVEVAVALTELAVLVPVVVVAVPSTVVVADAVATVAEVAVRVPLGVAVAVAEAVALACEVEVEVLVSVTRALVSVAVAVPKGAVTVAVCPLVVMVTVAVPVNVIPVSVTVTVVSELVIVLVAGMHTRIRLQDVPSAQVSPARHVLWMVSSGALAASTPWSQFILPMQADVSPQTCPTKQSPLLLQVRAWQNAPPEQVTPVEPSGQGGGQTGIAHTIRVGAPSTARMVNREALRMVTLRSTSPSFHRYFTNNPFQPGPAVRGISGNPVMVTLSA
jgi:hypothetical protein